MSDADGGRSPVTPNPITADAGASLPEHQSDTLDPARIRRPRAKQRERRAGSDVGAVLVAVIIVGVLLPPWLDRSSSEDVSAGALEVTRGATAPGTRNGTRILAPTFTLHGEPIPPQGTREARLAYVENLCAEVLDCSSCPHQIAPSFNASVLSGTLLIYSTGGDERLFMCGFNRLGRTFGSVGLAALAFGNRANIQLFTPGWMKKAYRIGEHRDRLPHDGDRGIPFPHVDVMQSALAPIQEALSAGEEIHAVLHPHPRNPYDSTVYGVWVPLRAGLIVGHFAVAERAVSFIVGHVKIRGIRADLAQIALLAEVAAHGMYIVWLFDPFCNYYWGWMPTALGTSLISGATVLTCCSTLLLAAYWIQMISNSGLSAWSIRGRLSASLTVLSVALGFHAVWLVWTDLFLEFDVWFKLRLPYYNAFKFYAASITTYVLIFVVALLFIISAVRAQNQVSVWANPEAGRRLMRRVQTSGALMVGVTIAGVLTAYIYFHPVGFVLWGIFTFPMLIWNSLLQINSFEPAGGAPRGPTCTVLLEIYDIAIMIIDARVGGAEDMRMEHGRQLLGSFPLFDDDERPTLTAGALSRVPSSTLTSLGASSEEDRESQPKRAIRRNSSPAPVPSNSQDCLDPWKRVGISLPALEAIAETYDTANLTTDAVCERVIKPLTRRRECCFIDLLHGHCDCPIGWLGPPTFFLSHWWGSHFDDLVRAMILNHLV